MCVKMSQAVQVNDAQGNPLEELLLVGDTKEEALQRLSHYGPGGLVRKDKIGLRDTELITAEGAPYVFKRQQHQQNGELRCCFCILVLSYSKCRELLFSYCALHGIY